MKNAAEEYKKCTIIVFARSFGIFRSGKRLTEKHLRHNLSKLTNIVEKVLHFRSKCMQLYFLIRLRTCELRLVFISAYIYRLDYMYIYVF